MPAFPNRYLYPTPPVLYRILFSDAVVLKCVYHVTVVSPVIANHLAASLATANGEGPAEPP